MRPVDTQRDSKTNILQLVLRCSVYILWESGELPYGYLNLAHPDAVGDAVNRFMNRSSRPTKSLIDPLRNHVIVNIYHDIGNKRDFQLL